MSVTMERNGEDEREVAARITEAVSLVAASNLPRIFDAHPLPTLILTRTRQIVYANQRALRLTGNADKGELVGLRLGEALGCVHARETPRGCGTSETCCYCGANRAMLKAASRPGTAFAGLEGFPAISFDVPDEAEECNIIREADSPPESSVDLRVWTEAIELSGRELLLLAAEDISAEKRREVLERVFYHDIANTASGIRTLLELFDLLGEDPDPRHKALLKSAAEQLVEEIESQRALKAAESRDLAVRFEIFEGRAVLEATLAVFAYKLEGKDIRLELAPGTQRVAVESDAILLRRVLVNMLKNAIEAAVRGEILLAGINVEEGRAGAKGQAVFWVRNSAVMPEVARRRVFHRSFSTKGRGRGIGTYSMRLLAESYLGGKVSFSSREGEGTVFELRIPLA